MPIPRRQLLLLLEALAAGEDLPPEYRAAEVSLLFCEDDLIRDLNRQYRGKDSPTDVLSFPQFGENGLLGEIVISVPAALRQARERRQKLQRELAWLFLHGMLHLFGYEDDTDAGAAAMDEQARAALGRLNMA